MLASLVLERNLYIMQDEEGMKTINVASEEADILLAT